MDRPVRFAAWLIALFFVRLSAGAAEAQVGTGAVKASAEAYARTVSFRMAEILTTAAAKSESPPVVRPESEPAVVPRVKIDRPANEIIRLPAMIVRERKLPTPEEVNPAEVARRAMEHYLGPENGFDRGFLNLFTSKQIPLLVFFGSVSNEARAMARYREDENKRLKEYFFELAELTTRSGDAVQGAILKKEAENVFRRR